MREAVIVCSVRTALAKSFRGSFNRTSPVEMAAHCIREVVRRVPALNPSQVEDVVLGCGYPNGIQGSNIARIASLRAQLPASVAATTVNRFCASGLQATAMAAHMITQEGADVAIAGGVESISLLSRDTQPDPWVREYCPGTYMSMGQTAEIVAKRYRISRDTQDEYALLSQQRTAEAQQSGRTAAEIAPMRVNRAILDRKTGQELRTEEATFCVDECNRPDTTLDALAALPPHFDPDTGHGTVTAGNSSQLSDGASAILLMSRRKADELGIKYQLIFRGYSVAGVEPEEMGIGPVYAVPRLLRRHGLHADDIDLWELNEAFAVQVVYCRDRLVIDPRKLNVNGGSISIGHPFGMTGSRLVGTLANELIRRKGRRGVVTMCVGGGQGAAALFEAAT